MSSRRKNFSNLVQITASSSQLQLPNAVGERALFIFGAKIGLKSSKNMLFCILFRPIGRGFLRPPPWLRNCISGIHIFRGFTESFFIIAFWLYAYFTLCGCLQKDTKRPKRIFRRPNFGSRLRTIDLDYSN